VIHQIGPSISTEDNTSVVDCISHTLLSALAGTQQGREWSKQVEYFFSENQRPFLNFGPSEIVLLFCFFKDGFKCWGWNNILF
jgi:hypothetical protein